MSRFTEKLLAFINESPSPYHAVHNSKKALMGAGFSELKENDPWKLELNGKYFFTRNQSCLVAFAVGGEYKAGGGITSIGAHTDCPCLKMKPISKITKQGQTLLGVQCYGGGLWHTWFDRDLALAGRVLVRGDNGNVQSHLVHLTGPCCRVPTLAIHLNREVNEKGFIFNKETQLLPLMALGMDEGLDQAAHSAMLMNALASAAGCAAADIIDMEIYLADAVPACVGGLQKDMIFAPRLDNLHSSFCGTEALVAASAADALKNAVDVKLLALFDNEEVGSCSNQGALSALLPDLWSRIACGLGNRTLSSALSAAELVSMVKANSYLLSADMAHACHPNYPEKHEDNHRVKLAGGPVVKINANQRYATTAETGALLFAIAKNHGIAMQQVVVRNDSACGSTIGPLSSANLGIRVADIGAPQLSMHSIREMCAVADVDPSVALFTALYTDFSAIDKTFQLA